METCLSPGARQEVTHQVEMTSFQILFGNKTGWPTCLPAARRGWTSKDNMKRFLSANAFALCFGRGHWA